MVEDSRIAIEQLLSFLCHIAGCDRDLDLYNKDLDCCTYHVSALSAGTRGASARLPHSAKLVISCTCRVRAGDDQDATATKQDRKHLSTAQCKCLRAMQLEHFVPALVTSQARRGKQCTYLSTAMKATHRLSCQAAKALRQSAAPPVLSAAASVLRSANTGSGEARKGGHGP